MFMSNIVKKPTCLKNINIALGGAIFILVATYMSFVDLEVCTGRNFRILPSPARTPLGPTRPEPEVYFQICYPYLTRARLFFIPAQLRPDVFTICPAVVSLIHVSFNQDRLAFVLLINNHCVESCGVEKSSK
jgi:hypothetical protein